MVGFANVLFDIFRMGQYEELQVYQISFELACVVHEKLKSFPDHERYALVDQLRRSSRSTCANIVEAYRKRRYPKHFISKLSDADGENTETTMWIDFAHRFGYIDSKTLDNLKERCISIGKLLHFMMNNPGRFS